MQEICHDIDQTCSLEALYENLVHRLAKIGNASVSDAGALAFMAIVKDGTAENAFQITHGIGRYATAAGSIPDDELIRECLSNAVRQRSNHHSQDAVTFYFPHPENLVILVYVELAQGIDAEARELLKFINDKVSSSIQTHSLAKQAMRTGRALVIALANRRIAESVLDELLNYTIDHFSREERYLQKSGYPIPDLCAHQLLHASFTDTIQEIRWQYQRGFRSKINREVLLFLRDWLSKHILVEDMKYAALVHTKR